MTWKDRRIATISLVWRKENRTGNAAARTRTPHRFARPAPEALDFSLLRNLKCVVDFDAEIPDCAFNLAMAGQQLDGPDVLRAFVNQCCLGRAHRMRAVGCRIKSSSIRPSTYHPGILSRGEMRRCGQPAGEEVPIRPQACLLQPRTDCLPGRFGQFKLDRALCLSLNDLSVSAVASGQPACLCSTPHGFVRFS
jgi:hypothetical protein